MSRRKRAGKNQHQDYTPITGHRRQGKKLLPPLVSGAVPVTEISWVKNLLPEFLWIDALVHHHGFGRALSIYRNVLDLMAFAGCDSDNTIPLGYVSCFDAVKPEQREEFSIRINRISGSLPSGFRESLLFHKKHPMRWLLEPAEPDNRSHGLTPAEEYLKTAVLRLLDGKDEHSIHCRSFPLSRMMQKSKVLFSREGIPQEVIDNLCDYPNCADRGVADAFISSTSCAMFLALKQDNEWAKEFWRSNMTSSACMPRLEELAASTDLGRRIGLVVAKGKEFVREVGDFLQKQWRNAGIDLYEPNKDEVLAGLLSREYRLVGAILVDPHLWSIDTGRIILRSIVEGLITFKYLVSSKSTDVFKRYQSYSLGNQKKLKLHLLQIREEGEVGEGIDGVIQFLDDQVSEETWEELLPIELGSWSGRDTRSIAIEVGLKVLYDLAFSPLSAEVHGEWVSLKSTNLVRCFNPLHRFHRIPCFDQVPLSLVVLTQGVGCLRDTYQLWAHEYGLAEDMPFAQGYLSETARIMGNGLRS